MLFFMNLYPFNHQFPNIHPSAFVAPSADLIGNVVLCENASVWYQCVLRADINRIHIGPATNIQDGSIIHLEDKISSHVTVGHRAIIHACTIQDECLIGMGSIIMDGAIIGAQSIVGAGSLVTMGTKIPPGSLVLGSPAKVVKSLDTHTRKEIRQWAEKYVAILHHYREEGIKTPIT